MYIYTHTHIYIYMATQAIYRATWPSLKYIYILLAQTLEWSH